MKIMLNHKSYCTDKVQPYIEFTFRVGGQSVAYALNKENRYEAEVLINVDVLKEDSVVANLHYILGSETFKRDYLLKNGNREKYNIEKVIEAIKKSATRLLITFQLMF